jgi:hypothetical protein
MTYLLRTIIIIVLIVTVFKGIKIFNKKIETKILEDINNHFESKGFTIKSITAITNNHKEIPFNVNEWRPATWVRGKDYYANRYWKIEVVDGEQNETIKWVNTGHLFMHQMYFIEKANNKASA